VGQPTEEIEERAREVGRRQSLSRDVNERIEELAEDFDLMDEMEILCECGHGGCHERIMLTEVQYEALRRIPTHFAVLPGHEIPADERVVEHHGGFMVVEKLGESAVTAVRLDPRRAKR
jgi:hypothetical protein